MLWLDLGRHRVYWLWLKQNLLGRALPHQRCLQGIGNPLANCRHSWVTIERASVALKIRPALMERAVAPVHTRGGGRFAYASGTLRRVGCCRLIIEMATSNSTWGYRRITGELAGLGYRVGASTVWRILKQRGIGSAPQRTSVTWTQFLRSLAAVACDFVIVETALLRR